MKKNFLALFVLFALTATAFADHKYGVNITDVQSYDDGQLNLYVLFNDYFGTDYQSSNAIFDERGLNPAMNWTTQNSQVVGFYRVAALGHTLSLQDSEGNSLARLESFNTSTAGLGIQDLVAKDIVDVSGAQWNLNATWQGNTIYNWSSDSTKNRDSQAHMLAFDITDLYNAKNSANQVTNAYMLAWEDLAMAGFLNGGLPADWDYQDFVAIVTMNNPDTGIQNTTPEPATAGLLLIGCCAAALRSRKKRS